MKKHKQKTEENSMDFFENIPKIAYVYLIGIYIIIIALLTCIVTYFDIL